MIKMPNWVSLYSTYPPHKKPDLPPLPFSYRDPQLGWEAIATVSKAFTVQHLGGYNQQFLGGKTLLQNCGSTVDGGNSGKTT